MTSREIKKKVKDFLKEYQVTELNVSVLRAILERQGYTVVAFNHLDNDESVDELIRSLQLEEMTDRAKGFTYADQDFRAVFVHEDLSEKETLMVLAHEEGHITCGHLSSVPVIGRDVQEEFEANEFAHYLMNCTAARRKAETAKKRKKTWIISICAVFLLSLTVGLVLYLTKPEKPVYENYYITETGFKYHRIDCIYVKDKDNVRPMTREEFESGEYDPCSVCMPDRK